MKSLILFCFIALSTLSVFAVNDDAIAYNDKIVNEQNKIGEAILKFSNEVSEASLEEILVQATKSIEVLNKMKSFDNNSDLLDAAKALFKFYKAISENEYKEILQILNSDGKYTKEEAMAKITEYSNSISTREKVLDSIFQKAQTNFANKYGFSLIKNELEEKFKENKDSK